MVGDGGAAVPGDPAASEGSVRARAVTEGPRERLMRLGPQALTDPELVAVLFGTGCRGNPVMTIAESLVALGGGLRALAQLEPEELCTLPGLGPARAAQLVAALELGRRVQRSQDTRPRLTTPKQIFDYVYPDLSALRREVFHVLCLNARNVLLHNARISEGTQSTCPVDPRDVFRIALATKAAALVLVHNHPSGDPSPSVMDVAMTRQLVRGASVLGIKVLDHVVIGETRYHSMAESGELARIEEAEGGVAWHERVFSWQQH
ncbi:MAG: DNA repair protein RadC [Myxococcaceae bacterium]|nr:DNA repair protein RadC [Myxococcaceae bacterium]